MSVILKILKSFFEKRTSGWFEGPEPDTSFIFPYSNDPEVRKQQIWSNLKKGILFEDQGRLLSWDTRFFDLDRYSNKREDSGDRTTWHFGERTILNGLKLKIDTMQYSHKSFGRPMNQVTSWLGFDDEVIAQFYYLRDYFTQLLGDPTESKIEPFGDLVQGHYSWTNEGITIRLSAWERFAVHHDLSIGLDDYAGL